jgi:4-amino-4-deoxy-L-arabinose transferase-like glycosyltransferase
MNLVFLFRRYLVQARNRIFGLSSASLIIILAAAVKFALHMYIDPSYGFFMDEFYTIALSQHLAFGYVDLPPLVPALVALSRALLGESLLAMHIVPALAGSANLVFVCLIAKEFGGKAFAVLISALGFLFVPLWLNSNSILCYDSIDQLVLAGFLYVLVRFLRSGNKRIWLVLGLIAGVACMTKMTILFLGPGFLIALLLSKYRKDLLTPWPWLGGMLCVVIVSPYLFWQIANQWPTLDYWNNYGTIRVYQASLPQYFTNILVYMNPFFLPLWIAGLYRIFRRLNGVNYGFLGILFLVTLVLQFELHATVRMLGALFIPLIAAGAVFVEETLAGIRWEKGAKVAGTAYLLITGIYIVPMSLPILPMDTFLVYSQPAKPLYQSLREFNGGMSYYPVFLAGRMGWDELAQGVATVYNQLPAEERAVAGIYAGWYMEAGAIDVLGPQYGLPHAVSGSLTYYLWGPGYSWDVMIIIGGVTNPLAMFFDSCEMRATIPQEYNSQHGYTRIYVCRQPKIPADKIWSSLKSYR